MKKASFLITIFIFHSFLIIETHATKQHVCSVYGNFKYPANFKNFDYVNPNAPKKGTLYYTALGSFSTLNSFTAIGNADMFTGILCTAKLFEESKEEPGTSYAYVAHSIEIDDKLEKVTFFLNENAVFDNGHPITADDVNFSFNALREHGHPMFQSYYKSVKQVKTINKHTIQFICPNNKNREIGLILGQIPVFSKDHFKNKSFGHALIKPMPSSGPYRIKKVELGKTIIFERITNWWGDKVPSQVGQYNPKEIHITYFRDPNAEFEAFKDKQSHIRFETQISRWITGYNFKFVKKGNIIQQTISHKMVAPTYGFFFNTRRDIFKNPKVREAITILFNFSWANKQFFHSQYKRNLSYFDNSPLAAKKDPPSQKELDILKPYEKTLDPRLSNQSFELPSHETPEDTRKIKNKALNILREAGWIIKNQKLVNIGNKKPLEFTLIISNKSIEKIALHLKNCLKQIGIHISVRLLDISTYQNRLLNLDYDMVFEIIPQSHLLGSEQYNYFGSRSANIPGTRNYAGIQSEGVDQIIKQLVNSKNKEEMELYAQILDRILLWGFYHIPAWHSDQLNLARWKNVKLPKNAGVLSPLLWALTTLWITEES